MRASESIKNLRELIARYGDLDIRYYGPRGEYAMSDCLINDIIHVPTGEGRDQYDEDPYFLFCDCED